MAGPTIVVSFGEGVDSANALVVVELDDSMNVSGGEVKNSFQPGDSTYFLIHHDANLGIQSVKSTSGGLFNMGTVSRTGTQEILFESTDHEVELTHNPTGGVSAYWYGNAATVTRSGRTVTANAAPCIGDISYTYRATLYRLDTPSMSLSEGDEYPIGVVVYIVEL